WSRGLSDMLPAITACLSREGNRAQSVAGASPVGSGTVRVRLIEGNAAVDCTVDAAGRGAPSIAAAGPAVATGPLFYPAREPPPIIACGRLERVQLRSATAGYLH